MRNIIAHAGRMRGGYRGGLWIRMTPTGTPRFRHDGRGCRLHRPFLAQNIDGRTHRSFRRCGGSGRSRLSRTGLRMSGLYGGAQGGTLFGSLHRGTHEIRRGGLRRSRWTALERTGRCSAARARPYTAAFAPFTSVGRTTRLVPFLLGRKILLMLVDDGFYFRAGAGIFRARGTDAVVAIGDRRRIYRRDGFRGEWKRPHAVDHERQIDLPDAEPHQIFRRERRLEHRLKHFRIERAGAEYEERPDVAEHGIAHLFFHLFDVLVGQGQREFIFARFTKDIGKCLVHHGLEFVDVEIEPRQLCDAGGRLIRARHRREVDLDDEHAPQKRRIGLPHAPLGKVHDEYFLLVHHFPDIETGFRLTDDVANERVRGELPDLVLDGGCRLARVGIGECREFFPPEPLHDGGGY